MEEVLYVGVKEAADRIGVKVRTIRQWIRNGKIHGEKNPISRRWFFEEEEVNRIAEVYKK